MCVICVCMHAYTVSVVADGLHRMFIESLRSVSRMSRVVFRVSCQACHVRCVMCCIECYEAVNVVHRSYAMLSYLACHVLSVSHVACPTSRLIIITIMVILIVILLLLLSLSLSSLLLLLLRVASGGLRRPTVEIHQRGGQWKQGVHPVSITRFPLTRFSPGSGLLRNPFVHR